MVLGLLMASCAGVGDEDPTPTYVPTATSVPTYAPTATPTPTPVVVFGYTPRDPSAALECEGGRGLDLWAHQDGDVLLEVGPFQGPVFQVRMMRLFICLGDGIEQADVEKLYPDFADDLVKIKLVDPQTFSLAAESLLFWHLAKAGYLSGYLIVGEDTLVTVDIYDFYQPGEEA